MARSRKLSSASKRRILMATKARHERALAKVAGQLEQCMSCDVDKLKKGLSSIEADSEKERKALLSRLGLSEADAAALLAGRAPGAPRKPGKKSGKKRAKAGAGAAARAPGETSKPGKKTSKKKAAKKRAGKKRAKKG